MAAARLRWDPLGKLHADQRHDARARSRGGLGCAVGERGRWKRSKFLKKEGDRAAKNGYLFKAYHSYKPLIRISS